MTKYTRLETYVNGRKPLHPNELKAFKELLLKGMRSPYRKQIIQRLTLQQLYTVRANWFYKRIFFFDGKCEYIAGQDYPAEIASIRDSLIKHVANA